MHGKSKLTAGLLAIHKFYLGYPVAGIIHLALIITGFGIFLHRVISLVEGIIYLSKSDGDFNQTYVIGRRQWF